MLYAICGFLVLALSLFGFVELIRKLIFAFYRPKNRNWSIIINPKGHNDDIEFVLRSFCEKAKWSINPPKRIIFLKKENDEQTNKISGVISKDYEFLEILSSEELCKIILDNNI